MEKIPPGYYLFQTPPFQKTTEKEFQSTLEELFCVPSGTFYLGYDDKSIEKSVFYEFLINLKAFENQVKSYLKASLLSKAKNI